MRSLETSRMLSESTASLSVWWRRTSAPSRLYSNRLSTPWAEPMQVRRVKATAEDRLQVDFFQEGSPLRLRRRVHRSNQRKRRSPLLWEKYDSLKTRLTFVPLLRNRTWPQRWVNIAKRPSKLTKAATKNRVLTLEEIEGLLRKAHERDLIVQHLLGYDSHLLAREMLRKSVAIRSIISRTPSATTSMDL